MACSIKTISFALEGFHCGKGGIISQCDNNPGVQIIEANSGI